MNGKQEEDTNSIKAILAERGSRYGDFGEHARITQDLKAIITSGDSAKHLRPAQEEALDMIAHKIGRIVNGDPHYLDSWVDIVGYAQLVVDDMQKFPHKYRLEPQPV